MSNTHENGRVRPAPFTGVVPKKSDTPLPNLPRSIRQDATPAAEGSNTRLLDALQKLGFNLPPLEPEAGSSAANPLEGLTMPEGLIALRASTRQAATAMWLLLEETCLPPLFRFRSGEVWHALFRAAAELKPAEDQQEGATPDQIHILFAGHLVDVTPQTELVACAVDTVAGLPEVSTPELALFLQHNRRALEAALAKAEDAVSHPLKRYSLRGLSQKLEAEMTAAVEVLPGLALRGQSTMIFAPPNTGKTLLILCLIIQALRAGLLEPAHLFYMNVDDNMHGLHEKLLLAEKHGFHMLAEGFQGFRTSDFLDQVSALIRDGHAPKTVIVLDTLKRFTDVMDKRTNSEFTKLVRRFVLKGGTVIALGHTNKKKGLNGKSTFAGTSDLIDDVDCAYVLDEVEGDRAEKRKIVEFQRIKGRGQVVERAAFSYSIADGLTYRELLASVEEVDPATLESIHHAAALQSDRPVIDAIREAISSGQNAKMQLITGVARQAKVSQRTVGMVLDRYTGEDPEQHCWTYTVRERGAKLYVLLPSDRCSPADP